MIDTYILERVVDYLVDRQKFNTQQCSREWWAYHDAIWLCHESTVQLEREAAREWEKLKGERQ